MRVHNKEIRINKDQELTFEYLDALSREYGEFAIRFVVCGCDDRHRFLEIDFLDADNSNPLLPRETAQHICISPTRR